MSVCSVPAVTTPCSCNASRSCGLLVHAFSENHSADVPFPDPLVAGHMAADLGKVGFGSASFID
jgi:hypothetical protein